MDNSAIDRGIELCYGKVHDWRQLTPSSSTELHIELFKGIAEVFEVIKEPDALDNLEAKLAKEPEGRPEEKKYCSKPLCPTCFPSRIREVCKKCRQKISHKNPNPILEVWNKWKDKYEVQHLEYDSDYAYDMWNAIKKYAEGEH